MLVLAVMCYFLNGSNSILADSKNYKKKTLMQNAKQC